MALGEETIMIKHMKNESDLIVLSFNHFIEEINDMYMTKKFH